MSDEKYGGAEKAAEVCSIWPAAAADQMGKMVQQCNLTDNILATDGRIAGNGILASRQGFVAEEAHAETFNLDAILKDKDVRAFTDRYPDSLLSSNNPTNDIVVAKNGQPVQGAQLKYYKDAKATANAFRENSPDGVPHYKDADTMIAPSDQLQGVKDAARKTELQNGGPRPQVADAAKDVQKKVSDHLEQDGVQSESLSRGDSEKIAKDAKQGGGEVHKKIQNKYKTASTCKQMGKAAGGAAVVTTVIAGTVNTVSYLCRVHKGEISMQDAIFGILKDTAIAAGDSALKAASATGAVSLAARYAPEIFSSATGSLQTSLVTGGIAGTTICAVDVVECLVLVAAGKMTWKQLETRTGKNLFQTGAGVVGSSIGTAVGAAAGPIGALVGSIVGGMITSVAMTMAIENGIERPFREIMANTESLVQAENVMKNAVQLLVQAESAFIGFREGLAVSEAQFAQHTEEHHRQSAAIWTKLNSMK